MTRCCKDRPKLRDMRERVVVEELAKTKNSTGGFEITWGTFATVSAKVKPKHAKEQLIAQRIDSAEMYEITIRYLEGLEEAMRLQWRGKTLQIKSLILLDGRPEYHSILAVKEGPGT